MRQVDANELRDLIIAAVRAALAETGPRVSWRTKLWDCSADTRIGVVEVAEALGCSKARIYRWTRLRLLPCKRLEGSLSFRAGDVRQFIKDRETAA
jgi:hypothetical protein